MRIADKIRVGLFFTAAIALVGSLALFYSVTRHALLESLSDHLNTTARSRANHIKTFLDAYKNNLILAGQDPRIHVALEQLGNGPSADTLANVTTVLQELKRTNQDCTRVYVADPQGIIIADTDANNTGRNISDSAVFSGGRDGFYAEDVCSNGPSDVDILAFAWPVGRDDTNRLQGILIMEVSANALNRITGALTGLGQSGEVYIVNRNGLMITPSRFTRESHLRIDNVNTQQCYDDVVRFGQRAHREKTLLYCDYRDATVLGTHAHIHDMRWCLCAKIDKTEAFAPLTMIGKMGLLIMAAVLAVVWLLGGVVARRLTKSIRELRHGIELVGQGDLKHRVEMHTGDEIAELSRAFDDMTEKLQSNMTSVNNLHREIEVRKRTETFLKAARDEAERATQAKGEFLANMSHELRTPMNAIIGFSQVLQSEDLPPEHAEYVGIIEDCCQRLLTLIDDILDLSKIEAGHMSVDACEFTLEKVLKEMEVFLRPLADKKNLGFSVEMCGTVPPTMRTDPVRLHQCLINLIGNAIKFTDEGRVQLKVSAAGNGQPCVRFDIEDTGPGIPDDKQSEIFEAFKQADGSATRKHGGTGLGLAIVKQLVELLGGHISVESGEGKGSTFTVILPAYLETENGQPDLQCNVEELIETEDSEPVAFSTGEHRSAHILVAEDSLTNEKLIRVLLERMGHEVTVAHDGIEAVEATQEQHFDLIFMDMQMPRMNGYEAAGQLKQNGLDTPIIALTAHAMNGDRRKCMHAGCDDYLSKPIDNQRLLQILNKYLPVPANASVD